MATYELLQTGQTNGLSWDRHSQLRQSCAPSCAFQCSQFAARRKAPCSASQRVPLRHGHTHRRHVVTRAAPTRAPRWETVWEDLVVKRGFESTSAKDALEKVESGDWVLVDVRPNNRYEESHPEGAVNVPLYQKVDFSKPSFTRYLRAAALMVNGVEPVELNPDFLDNVKREAGGKGLILFCEIGGTLDPSASFGNGKVSRSLLAAYSALSSGMFESGKVAHLRGGVYSWYNNGLPMSGEYDARFAGRTPSVKEEAEFSYGRAPSILKDD